MKIKYLSINNNNNCVTRHSNAPKQTSNKYKCRLFCLYKWNNSHFRGAFDDQVTKQRKYVIRSMCGLMKMCQPWYWPQRNYNSNSLSSHCSTKCLYSNNTASYAPVARYARRYSGMRMYFTFIVSPSLPPSAPLLFHHFNLNLIKLHTGRRIFNYPAHAWQAHTSNALVSVLQTAYDT